VNRFGTHVFGYVSASTKKGQLLDLLTRRAITVLLSSLLIFGGKEKDFLEV
jgi:hypothetical protein